MITGMRGLADATPCIEFAADGTIPPLTTGQTQASYCPDVQTTFNNPVIAEQYQANLVSAAADTSATTTMDPTTLILIGVAAWLLMRGKGQGGMR